MLTYEVTPQSIIGEHSLLIAIDKNSNITRTMYITTTVNSNGLHSRYVVENNHNVVYSGKNIKTAIDKYNNIKSN